LKELNSWLEKRVKALEDEIDQKTIYLNIFSKIDLGFYNNTSF